MKLRSIAGCVLLSAFVGACGTTGEGEKTLVESQAWTFDTAESVAEWFAADGEFWQYTGGVTVSFDEETVGGGALRLDLDFSAAENQNDWSEPKIKTVLEPPLAMDGYNEVRFDFYYQPEARTKGGFQVKLFANGGLDANTPIPAEGERVSDAVVKVPVSVKMTPMNGTINGLTFSIIGSGTDYKGAVLIDNLRFVQGAAADVKLRKSPKKTAKLPALKLAERVTLVDGKAGQSAARLYAYLEAVGKTKYVIFGHQNDAHHKRGAFYEGATNSDTKDMTGSLAGVIGIDSLSLIGDEYPGVLQNPDSDPVRGSAKVCIDAAKEGSLITLSCHMPNFEEVKNKGKNGESWNFSGYSVGNLNGDVMRRILPGGDLNEVFTAYLDIIANFAKQLDAEGVPVLFRPFHENNGSWFWWGASGSSEEGYKNVFRYTVEYMRDSKNVHNFLYVY